MTNDILKLAEDVGMARNHSGVICTNETLLTFAAKLREQVLDEAAMIAHTEWDEHPHWSAAEAVCHKIEDQIRALKVKP